MDLQVAQAPAADRVALREQPREPADARPSANPSLDAGFMQIPNELVDALVLYPGPGSAKDFVLAVARETLGWGRQRRRISTARLCRMTGWRPRRLRRVREYAAHANLIEWRAPDLYGIKTDYSLWLVLQPAFPSNEEARKSRSERPAFDAETLERLAEPYAEKKEAAAKGRPSASPAEKGHGGPPGNQAGKHTGQSSPAQGPDRPACKGHIGPGQNGPLPPEMPHNGAEVPSAETLKKGVKKGPTKKRPLSQRDSVPGSSGNAMPGANDGGETEQVVANGRGILADKLDALVGSRRRSPAALRQVQRLSGELVSLLGPGAAAERVEHFLEQAALADHPLAYLVTCLRNEIAQARDGGRVDRAASRVESVAIPRDDMLLLLESGVGLPTRRRDLEPAMAEARKRLGLEGKGDA